MNVLADSPIAVLTIPQSVERVANGYRFKDRPVVTAVYRNTEVAEHRPFKTNAAAPLPRSSTRQTFGRYTARCPASWAYFRGIDSS